MSFSSTSIRASPYEPGLYFVSPEPGTTLQSIGTTEWKVGDRYRLERVLGYGSFSCVCLAFDTATGERVALKRVGDVLSSVDQAKRALREVAILRRTQHPNLIGLRDCFLRPSATGSCRLVAGRLVPSSLDLYLAMEYAEGGDLFHMRGQLAPEEVISCLWQLLQAVKYLHGLHVWHRDVKSQNAFIHWERGVRVVKLGDFGSARSALGHEIAANGGVSGRGSRADLLRRRGLTQEHKSYLDMDAAIQSADLYAQPSAAEGDNGRPGSAAAAAAALQAQISQQQQNGSRPGSDNSMGRSSSLERPRPPSSAASAGFKAPLTRVVATPCYRAPEVVMSRGGYTSALDTWGVGCVFGELLQRVAYVGSAATPHLAVAPLFALRCMPRTPGDGETFGRPECVGTRRELQALFDVVGTPSWRDAASVEMPEWRRYLERLPGRAPTLYRRFKAAGEVAVHLLARLLDFDPGSRATPEEALAHEFFSGLRVELAAAGGPGALEERAVGSRPGTATPGGDSEMCEAVEEGDEEGEEEGGDGGTGGTGDAVMLSSDLRNLSFDVPVAGEILAVDAAAAVATRAAAAPVAAVAAAAAAGTIWEEGNAWDEANPGRALALLEDVLEEVSAGQESDRMLDPFSDGGQRLRDLLEGECAAAAAEAAARRAARVEKEKAAEAANPAAHGSPTCRQPLEGVLRRGGPGLVEDAAATAAEGRLGHRSTPDYGRERLSNVADTWQGRELDPRKFLGSKRHGEWTTGGGGEGPPPGLRWGVATIPPGIDPADPRASAIVKKQQER